MGSGDGRGRFRRAARGFGGHVQDEPDGLLSGDDQEVPRDVPSVLRVLEPDGSHGLRQDARVHRGRQARAGRPQRGLGHLRVPARRARPGAPAGDGEDDREELRSGEDQEAVHRAGVRREIPGRRCDSRLSEAGRHVGL